MTLLPPADRTVLIAPRRIRVLRRSLAYILLALGPLLVTPYIHRSTWMGSPQLHTLFETVCVFLTLTTGVMALVRYYTKKSNTYLLLGSGFLGTTALNSYHVVFTSTFLAGHTPSALGSLTIWSGAVPQLFLSLILFVSVLVWKIETTRHAPVEIKEGYVYCFMGLCTVATSLFFAFVNVPQGYYPDRMISHPSDMLQSVFFGAALLGYLLRGAWKGRRL